MAEYTQLSLIEDENPKFLSEQIITYIGNKRALLSFIELAVNIVKSELSKDKLDVVDVFSGSGIVSRYLKKHARNLYCNDQEGYCEVINKCYLANKEDINFTKLEKYFRAITSKLEDDKLKAGFISELYSPKDDNNIQFGERVFYTTRNAKYIDTARKLIEKIPEPYKFYLLAPLLYEASVHNNTSGVFKGFYKNSETGIGQYGGNGKNALTRIMGNIELKMPVFSNYSANVFVYKKDAKDLVDLLPLVDLAYMDPPYNQHPYGSNYFMLNLINEYERPNTISKISGIPTDWNKSDYNNAKNANIAMKNLCTQIKAKYLLISFNNEGFIKKENMLEMLSELGEVRVFDKEYNTFRGCRNLNDRDIHVKEYLYLLRKREC